MLKLSFDIVQSLKESDIVSDFVAFGNLLLGTESFHSAFVIQYQNKLYEFHYTGAEIEYVELRNDYFHKITNTILPDEVPSFIAMCKNILKNANPSYGYFYSGESYTKDGVHLSNIDLGERMTCVGFCLNVMAGFLEEDYINYEEWSSDTHEDPEYLTRFCEKHNLDITKIKSAHRRITPRECLISGYFDSLPITKTEIDSKKVEIEEYFTVRLAV